MRKDIRPFILKPLQNLSLKWSFIVILLFTDTSLVSAQNKWYKQTSWATSNFSDMSFVDTVNGWVAGSWPIYHTSDAGRHWEPQVPVDSPYYGGGCIGFRDSMEGWVGGWWSYGGGGGGGVVLYHTTDGGNHWLSNKHSKASEDYIEDIDIHNPNCGVAVGHYWVNMEQDYDYIFSLFNVHGVTISFDYISGKKACFLDSLHGWYSEKGTNSHTLNLFYTSMGLDSLKVIDSSFVVNDFYFTDTLNGWAVVDSGVILHSINSGVTWDPETSGVTNNLASVDFIDSLNGWVVGSGGCILRTRDGGKLWVADSSPTTMNLHKVQFIDTSHGWAVGDGGTILYYGPYIGIEESDQPFAANPRLYVTNNPFRANTVIRYSFSHYTNVQLMICDLSGRTVKTLVNEEKLAGNYNINFSAKGLSTGIYFVRFSVGDYKETKKLVLMK